MYPNNSFSRRRASGWAERRRYFKRLLERASGSATSPREEASKKKETAKEKE